MSAAIAAGVLAIGSAERSARRFAASGCPSASAIACESFSASAAGVFGGADTLNQATETKPG